MFGLACGSAADVVSSYRDRWHDLRGQPYPLEQVVAGLPPALSSKKGMSAHQLHRMLKVTYRSAWFMAHRIRYTMTQEPLSSKLDGIIEIDETWIGGKIRQGSRTRLRKQKRTSGTN